MFVDHVYDIVCTVVCHHLYLVAGSGRSALSTSVPVG